MPLEEEEEQDEEAKHYRPDVDYYTNSNTLNSLMKQYCHLVVVVVVHLVLLALDHHHCK